MEDRKDWFLSRSVWVASPNLFGCDETRLDETAGQSSSHLAGTDKSNFLVDHEVEPMPQVRAQHHITPKWQP